MRWAESTGAVFKEAPAGPYTYERETSAPCALFDPLPKAGLEVTASDLFGSAGLRVVKVNRAFPFGSATPPYIAATVVLDTGGTAEIRINEHDVIQAQTLPDDEDEEPEILDAADFKAHHAEAWSLVRSKLSRGVS